MTKKIDKKKISKTLQFFAAYLVAAWTLLQFVDWVLIRYSISPYWVDLLLWIFIGIIPSLIIYLYNQERINNRILKLREKIIFPLNILLLMGITYFVFGNSDLGATTKEIKYTDEDGTIKRRQITKDKFRIGIPVYNFKQISKDSSSLWLENGISYLLYLDMHQDKNVNAAIYYADNTTVKVQESKIYYDHYVDGSYELKGDYYIVTTNLRESSNGKIKASKQFKHSQLSKLLDSISIYIRDKVGVTKQQRNQYVDLEIQEFTSDSLKAIEHFVQGKYEEAIAIDSTFSLAYFKKASRNILYSQGKIEERINIDQAFKHRSKLPADKQMEVLIYKYMAYDQWQKAENLVKLQLEIEPNNQIYINLLYTLFSETQQVDAYIDFAIKRWESDNSSDNAGPVSWALLFNEDYKYYTDYIDGVMASSPDNDWLYLYNIAPYTLKGDIANARKVLEKGRMLKPEWENIYKVYDSAFNYLDTQSGKKIDLSAFTGEFRALGSEMEFKIWTYKNTLLQHASNQSTRPAFHSGKDEVTAILHQVFGLCTIKLLRDQNGKTYGILLEQYDTENSRAYPALKLDESITNAEALFEKKKLDYAKIAYAEAIKANPKHFYLKDILTHINYMQSINSVALQNQFKDVVGTYGPRTFWIDQGKLFYKRDGLPRIELLPIAKDRYTNMTKFNTHFAFEFENGKPKSSFVYQYVIEEETWIKSELEGNTFEKD